jgi:hypothetical protein
MVRMFTAWLVRVLARGDAGASGKHLADQIGQCAARRQLSAFARFGSAVYRRLGGRAAWSAPRPRRSVRVDAGGFSSQDALRVGFYGGVAGRFGRQFVIARSQWAAAGDDPAQRPQKRQQFEQCDRSRIGGLSHEIDLHIHGIVLLVAAIIEGNPGFQFRGLSNQVIPNQVDQVDRLQRQACQALYNGRSASQTDGIMYVARTREQIPQPGVQPRFYRGSFTQYTRPGTGDGTGLYVQRDALGERCPAARRPEDVGIGGAVSLRHGFQHSPSPVEIALSDLVNPLGQGQVSDGIQAFGHAGNFCLDGFALLGIGGG